MRWCYTLACMSRHLFVPVSFLISLAILTGCQKEEADLAELSDTVQESIRQTVNRAVTEARNKVDELRPGEVAQEEFNKLQAFEYHVESVFLPTSAADLQLRLNELGKDKWECSSPVLGLTDPLPIQAEQKKMALPDSDRGSERVALIVCKRRPATYLRMLNRMGP